MEKLCVRVWEGNKEKNDGKKGKEDKGLNTQVFLRGIVGISRGCFNDPVGSLTILDLKQQQKKALIRTFS